ncbi:ABC transporter substrate-binding protein [Vibrio bivalvicida]|uniref:SsuA/THI5-like domain-containing protein n=1 Tax=Vibrio bivalvicida TaxID=1276888 RepID=A0A177XXX6_9VIBR|nr:ABC transporter substrate-binding protein [Vibrio bivalvicida]OAJ93450.1 hypothetical protein APB76_15960 [Vibrio bivalvicida]
MHRKLTISAALLAFSIVSLMWWYSSTTMNEETETTGLPMTVARGYWPGTFWIEIADQKDWFEEAGLDVKLFDTHPDYWGSLKAMVDGEIDNNNFTLFDLIQFNISGSDIVMVNISDNSMGVDAIVASPEVASITDLKGKAIGVDQGTYLEYILDVVLKRHGVSASDVIKVNVSGEEAASEFAKGKLDAIVTWEPIASQAIESRQGHKLFDTSEIPGISPSGLSFHRSFINERYADVQAFINVWHKTTQFIFDHPIEAYSIIANIYGVPLEDVQAFAQLNHIVDLRGNVTSFSYGAGFQSLHGTARQINKFLIEQNVTQSQVDSMTFIDARFIRTVQHSSQQVSQ